MKQLVLDTILVALKTEISNRVYLIEDKILVSLGKDSIARISTKKTA